MYWKLKSLSWKDQIKIIRPPHMNMYRKYIQKKLVTKDFKKLNAYKKSIGGNWPVIQNQKN